MEHKDLEKLIINLADSNITGISFASSVQDALRKTGYIIANDRFYPVVEEQKEKVQPKFAPGDVMRTLQEAEQGITDGLPIVEMIGDEYYRCNNCRIAIKEQDDYEYPPVTNRRV